MKKWMFWIVWVHAYCVVSAQRVYTPAELKQDFTILKAALQEAHPGLYRYNSKETIDNLFNAVQQKLNTGMTELEFYRLVAPLLSAIGDGHTKWHRKDKVDDRYAFFDEGYFPLQLYFRKNKAYVSSSYLPGEIITPGTEILSINGENIDKIREKLFSNIFSDGRIVSSKYQELNHFFAGDYATYVSPAKQFTVEYTGKNGKRETVTLSSISKTNISPEVSSNEKFNISYPEKGVALMRIPVFEDEDKTPSYPDFLASAFKEIRQKKISSLIIDLRNNEGGTDAFGFQLYAYLTRNPFRYYDHFSVVTNQPYSFAQYAQFPPGIDSLKATLVKAGNEFHFIYKDGLDTLDPQADAFTGKVYILQNGSSFSVTSEFCSIAKDNQRAIMIGDENGGTFQGNNSGGFALVELPNTKIGLDIPLLGYYMHLQHPHSSTEGIPADYSVIPSIENVLQKKDVVLEKALQLINK
jgi:Peptidase family S41